MDDKQIERLAERKLMQLDKRFLAGELTRAEYDLAVKAVGAETDEEYRRNGLTPS